MASNHHQALSRSQSEGPYVLLISGLPRGYTWQDLKDTVRPQASHGIWAYMLHPSPDAATGSGWVKVQRWNEARDLYNWLINDQPSSSGKQKDWRLCNLAVCLYDVYGQLKDSCRVNSTDVYTYAQNAMQRIQPHFWQIVNPPQTPSVSQSGAFYAPGAHAPYSIPGNSNENPMSEIANLNEAQARHIRAQQANRQRYIMAQQASLQSASAMAYTQSTSAMPMNISAGSRSSQQSISPVRYAPSSSGTPINTSAGYILTENCGVFVHGLNFRARTSEVKSFFSEVGDVVDCNIAKESRTGKSKGYATVLYGSRQEAQRAIQRFNGRNFMGRPLDVRIDKESTKILGAQPESSNSRYRSTTEPLVVNGSGSSRHGSG